MTRFLIAAAATTLAFATPAFAQDGKTVFTEDGVTYSYTTKKVGDLTVIEGVTSPGGRFYLEVRKGRVTGVMNSTRVAFDAPKRKVGGGQVASAH